jgi:transposase
MTCGTSDEQGSVRSSEEKYSFRLGALVGGSGTPAAQYLPQEMGCGSGMSCWRRLREWQQAGMWERLHEVLLSKLHRGADRRVAGGDRQLARVRRRGARKQGPSPVDRGRRAPSTT